jgi:hypothetical protein
MKEYLKKYCGYSAARNFGVLARLSEGACPKRPVIERKRSQNPKEPLLPNGYSIYDNAPDTKSSTLGIATVSVAAFGVPPNASFFLASFPSWRLCVNSLRLDQPDFNPKTASLGQGESR